MKKLPKRIQKVSSRHELLQFLCQQQSDSYFFFADSNTEGIDELDKMKVTQLKTLCKERGLKVSGKKSVLQERLREHFLSATSENQSNEASMDEFDALTDEDLADAVKARGLSSDGTREALLEKIRADIKYTSELLSAQAPQSRDGYVAISEALEEAARKEGGALSEYLNEFKLKSSEVPKYMDVTITSLGKLEPEIFTAGGAPSVTANVLKKLAGDPFADPPKYGSVSHVCFPSVVASSVADFCTFLTGFPTRWEGRLRSTVQFMLHWFYRHNDREFLDESARARGRPESSALLAES